MKDELDFAVGIVPVYKRGSEWFFCIVKHAKGHWGFPKGHKEEGESDEEAALRELKEETGVDDITLLSDIRLSESYSFERHNQKVEKDVVYFVGLVTTPKGDTAEQFKNEIIEIRWISLKEARELITFDESRRILDETWEYIKNHLK